MLASHHQLSNLCCIIDYNHSNDRSLEISPLDKKLNSFGKISEDIFHSFRNYNKTMLPWIKDLKEGESAFDNKKITHRPHQIIKGEIVVNKNKNGDKYKRNYWNEIAPCIHTRNDILASQNTIHPSENRVFSIRELMKFMSIPNSFKWSDQSEKKLNQFDVEEKNKFLKKNELNIRRCIGEAVPTKVLNSIAKKIKVIHIVPITISTIIGRTTREGQIQHFSTLKREHSLC